MTEHRGGAPDPGEWTGAARSDAADHRASEGDSQSEGSLFNDELGDSLAIDGSVDGYEAPAPAPMAAWSPPGYQESLGKHRMSDPSRDPDATDPHGPAIVPTFAAEEPPSGRRRKREKRKRRKAPWWELPVLVAVAIVIAVVVKTFVVQPFYIPSESMEHTLYGCQGCHGDRILVNKPIYDIRDPHPGDIIVFHAPQGWDDEAASVPPGNPVLKVVRGFGQLIGFVPPDGLVLVKRVIATGGQTVKGDADGQVMISNRGTDGPWRTLTEPYVYRNGTDPHAQFGPVTVPKGRLWVMGDHRNDSADSRFHCGSGGAQAPSDATCDPQTSTVPVRSVIGKAVLIAWPPSRWRTLGTPATFKQAADAALPGAAGAVVVLPIYLIRRRRRP